MASTFARTALVVAFAALALACGSDRRAPAAVVPDVPALPDDDVDPIQPPPPGRACNGEITLRLRGVNPGPVAAFHLDVSGASFTLDGGAPVQGLGAQTLDLLMDHGWRLGTLPYPENAAMAIATVGLAGGHATTATGEVTFPACLAPLEIPIKLSKIDPANCHAVIHLDLARSVVASAGTGTAGATFMPAFAVYY